MKPLLMRDWRTSPARTNEDCGVSAKGLGNRLTVCGLLDLQKSEKADILFLSETKMDDKRMQWFRWTFGLVNMVVKDYEGKGGIALPCCGGGG